MILKRLLVEDARALCVCVYARAFLFRHKQLRENVLLLPVVKDRSCRCFCFCWNFGVVGAVGDAIDQVGHQRNVPRADAAGAPSDGAGGLAVGRDGHPAEILDHGVLEGCQAAEGAVIDRLDG